MTPDPIVEEPLVEEPLEDPTPAPAVEEPHVEEPEPDDIDAAMRTLEPQEREQRPAAPREAGAMRTFTPPAAVAKTLADIEREAAAELGIPSRDTAAVLWGALGVVGEKMAAAAAGAPAPPFVSMPTRQPDSQGNVTLSGAPPVVLPAEDTVRVPAVPLKVKAEHKALAVALEGRVRDLTIVDATTHLAAGELLKEVKGFEKRIETTWDPLIAPANKAHKDLTAAKAEVFTPIQNAARMLAQKFGAWDFEQRRRADELRRQAEQAERDRQRQALEDEAAALERKVATAVTSEQAVEASSMAATLRHEAATLPAPVVDGPAPEVAQVAGVSSRANWKAEVTDLAALVGAVARGEAPLAFLEPNMQALTLRAKAEKEAMRVPGVRAVNKAGATVRGGGLS
jgi:hypothetical protein